MSATQNTAAAVHNNPFLADDEITWIEDPSNWQATIALCPCCRQHMTEDGDTLTCPNTSRMCGLTLQWASVAWLVIG